MQLGRQNRRSELTNAKIHENVLYMQLNSPLYLLCEAKLEFATTFDPETFCSSKFLLFNIGVRQQPRCNLPTHRKELARSALLHTLAYELRAAFPDRKHAKDAKKC